MKLTRVPRRVVGVALSIAMLGAIAGCQGGSMESEVSGTVTLDGKGIGPGLIVFAPAAKGGKPATGSIEADGSYSLNTSRELGLAAGNYLVAISIRQMPQNVKRGDRPPPGKPLIPEKYEDQNTSGLKFDVAPGSNTINIKLVSR